jgi:hypothetical protein
VGQVTDLDRGGEGKDQVPCCRRPRHSLSISSSANSLGSYSNHLRLPLIESGANAPHPSNLYELDDADIAGVRWCRCGGGEGLGGGGRGGSSRDSGGDEHLMILLYTLADPTPRHLVCAIVMTLAAGHDQPIGPPPYRSRRLSTGMPLSLHSFRKPPASSRSGV